ncbi:ABC transporter permease [Actinomadura atramentaria]|uniref:ABC transporter permease n=1 Tax=Actinomadura atramentaria TaxID=1990 RepID=UPI000360139F|nr:ABC transporter permease [Actinomadura atramentaria]
MTAALVGYLADTRVLAGRHLLHLRRTPGRLVLMTLNPLVMLLALGYLFRHAITVPGGRYEEYVLAGVGAQVGLAQIGPTAIGVAADLRGGVTDRFRAMPVPLGAVLLGRTLSDLAVAAVSLAAVAGLGALLGWRPHHGPAATAAGFAVLLAFCYAMAWAGVLLGTLVRDAETLDSVGALILVVFGFLSNAFLAASSLPGWLRPVAEWNPVSSVVGLCRRLWGNAAAGQSTGAAGATAAAVLLALLAAAVVLSLRALRGR